jgi:hypothetical protein
VGALVIIVCGFVVVLGLGLAAIRSAGRPAAGVSPEAEAKRLALEFRGVVESNTRVAHAFDAGYECRVKIKCLDGQTASLTTSVFEENRYPVGAKVIKRAGQLMPEVVADTEPWT